MLEFRIVIRVFTRRHVHLYANHRANYANYSLLALFRRVAGGYYSMFKKQYHTNSFKIYFIQMCLVSSQ